MSQAIVKYFAALQFKVDQRSLKQLDNSLNQTEKKLQAFSKKSNKLLTDAFKSFTLPPMVIKKIQIDPLQLQRSVQMSLNKTARLVELPISRFNVDEAKLQSQLKNIFQRSMNANRLNLRTIQGSSGGGNYYGGIHAKQKQQIANYASPSHIPMPNMINPSVARLALGGGLGGGIGAMGTVGTVAGAGVGIVAGGAVAGWNGARNLGQDQATKEGLRAQLDSASGQKTRLGMDMQNKRYFDLANQTGNDAADSLPAYKMLMKGLTAQGLKTNEAFDLYKNISLYAKGSGATNEQLSNASYAVNQAVGKQFLSREEYSTQILDALPSFSKFIKQSYANASGKKDNASFEKALTNKQITIDMMKEAFRLAAQSTSGNVATLSNTVEADQARFRNAQLEEQMARTLSDDVIPGMKNYTQAQTELYQSMAPLRSQMYDLSAGILNFSAAVMRSSVPFAKWLGEKGAPDTSIKSHNEAPTSSASNWGGAGPMQQERYGMFANRDKALGPASVEGIQRFKDLGNSFKPNLGPVPIQSESYFKAAQQSSIVNNAMTVSVTNHFNGLDLGGAEQKMTEISKRVFGNVLVESMQNYPQGE